MVLVLAIYNYFSRPTWNLLKHSSSIYLKQSTQSTNNHPTPLPFFSPFLETSPGNTRTQSFQPRPSQSPMAWICQLKMLWKYLVLQLQTKRSKGVMNRHKNDDVSYIHAKEIKKWNKNALNAIITCANNIQKNCFIVMTALKGRLIQSRQRGNNFWKFFYRINHIRLLYLHAKLQLKTISG